MITNKKINNIQNVLRYRFLNLENLKSSLTHPSIIKYNKKSNNKYVYEFERLEFLGDRVLGLIISSLIFNKFDKYNEGSLTKKFSYLVQKEFLYKIALKLELELFITYNKKNLNNRRNKSILSDSVESIIGAIFIDGGYNASLRFVKRIWTPYLDLSESNRTDPKTKLQEISQKKFKILPEYKLLNKRGPSHSPLFTISLKALNLEKIKTSGGSIQDAEKKAAKQILELINEQ